MKSLAEQVKDHMDAMGLNATEYAQRVGTSRQNIEKLLAGDTKQPRYIAKLAKFMGTSVDELLGIKTAPQPQPPSIDGRPANDTVRQIVALANPLTQPQLDQLLGLTFELWRHPGRLLSLIPVPGPASIEATEKPPPGASQHGAAPP